LADNAGPETEQQWMESTTTLSPNKQDPKGEGRMLAIERFPPALLEPDFACSCIPGGKGSIAIVLLCALALPLCAFMLPVLLPLLPNHCC